MKILAIAHGMLLGGAQVSTLEFLKQLRSSKSDIELRLITCNNARREFIDQAKSLNIAVYRVPCRFSMNYPLVVIEEAKDLLRWADVVWITDEGYLVAPKIKRIRNVPVAAHLRSYALICHWWSACYGLQKACLEKCSPWRTIRCKQSINLEYSRIGLLGSTKARTYWLLDFAKGPLDLLRWRAAMSGVLDNIDGFIAVSKALWDIHVKHVPELKDRPHAVVYNPVTEPLKYVKPDPSEPYGDYILYASGSNPVKGPHVLLDAWSVVSREFRDLKLYMVGCRDSWVKRYAKRLGLNSIVFLDKLSPSSYYNAMYRARAIVMPSVWPEPLGRIPIEANRLGVPAIVSSSGGLPEVVVDGVTGHVFRSGDAEDLAEKIVRALMKDFNRSTVIQYSYEKVNPQKEVEKLLRFFEEVIGSGEA